MDDTKPANVLVVGSANMDMVVSCERFPRPGETLFGQDFRLYPGGKGANQAVACARLGAYVQIIGQMGTDPFRARLTESLAHDGIHLDGLLTDPERPTGTALITVDAGGENQIIVVSGSNMRLTPADLDAHVALFEAARVVLLQLEIPLETVEHAARLGKANGATVVLNPAPAQDLPGSLLRLIDVLTPNEMELGQLSGVAVRDEASAGAAAQRLVAAGVQNVIVTLGACGALHVTADATLLHPARPVQAVDTTAAGDAFSGALALALAEGRPLVAAVPYANTVAAFAVTRHGAQTAMPTRAQLAAFDAPLGQAVPGDGSPRDA
jgi:ribokinase